LDETRSFVHRESNFAQSGICLSSLTFMYKPVAALDYVDSEKEATLLTHILQSALCFGVDLALAFPAVALAKRESVASGVRNPVLIHDDSEGASVRKIGAMVATLPACREKVAAVIDKAAERPLHTRASA
jgi:hypothetical protein